MVLSSFGYIVILLVCHYSPSTYSKYVEGNIQSPHFLIIPVDGSTVFCMRRMLEENEMTKHVCIYYESHTSLCLKLIVYNFKVFVKIYFKVTDCM